MNQNPADHLRSFLEKHLIKNETPGKESYFSIKETALVELASRRGETMLQVMKACLERDLWPERFRAHRGTLTSKDQVQLLQSTVAVIGAGGLGGTLCLLLARTGVGRLIVCDGDEFEESNLNRQFLSNLSRLGQKKALCAAEEIRRINPAAQVTTYTFKATEENLPDILAAAQVVVDCLDNFPTRLMVEKAARRLGLPFIHGAVGGLEGLILTVFPEDPGLENLYGSEDIPKEKAAEAVLGVPPVTPTLVAGLQAAEVINILTGRPPLARGRLLHVDLTIPSIEANSLL